MKKAILLVGLLVSMVSLSGCLEEQQDTSGQQPAWQYKCPDGSWADNQSLCQGNGLQTSDESQQLLERPLAEYALSQEDVKAGHIKNEELSRYYTLEEIIWKDEDCPEDPYSNELYNLIISYGFNEYYETGFQKGDPAGPESAISHKLGKYDSVEGAKQSYARDYEEFKTLVKKMNKNRIVIAVLRIPTKGDESHASYSRAPSEMYILTFRTKNVNHTIYLLSHTPVFSIEDALLYADKIIEKTKR